LFGRQLIEFLGPDLKLDSVGEQTLVAPDEILSRFPGNFPTRFGGDEPFGRSGMELTT